MSAAANNAGVIASGSVTVTGLTGFTTTNFAATAAPGGVAWGTTGADAVLFRLTTQAVGAANRTLFSRRQGAAGRWIRIQGAMTSLNGTAYNGVAVQFPTPTRTLTAADVGKLIMAVTVLDTGFHRLYYNRALIGSTAIVGHTPGAAPATRAGILDGALEPGTDGIEWFGGAQTNLAPTQAEVEAWFDAVKAAKKMVACPGVTTEFVRSVNAAGSGFDGSGSTMSITGSLTVVKRPLVWGW